MLPHDRNGLCRGDVETGIPVVGVRGHVEVFLYKLLSTRESVAPAHGEDYGRSLAESGGSIATSKEESEKW
jgi:hypothetical protein